MPAAMQAACGQRIVRNPAIEAWPRLHSKDGSMPGQPCTERGL